MSWSWDQFFHEGIFIRLSSGQWCLGHGPFSFTAEGQENSSHVHFYLNDFFLKSTKSLCHPAVYRLWSVEEVVQHMGAQKVLPISKKQWQKPDKVQFKRKVLEVQNHMNLGQVDKVVPVVRERAQDFVTYEERVHFFTKLLQAPSHLTPYGFWQGERRGFMGLTPEKLFEVENQKLMTMALAGTSTQKGFLIQNTKELREHNFVKDYLLEQLAEEEQLSVSSTYEWNIGSMFHLRTDFDFVVSQWSIKEFQKRVHQLHPTPALGVFPVSERGWLHQQEEAHWRSQFGAPFGVFLSAKQSLAVICIRGIFWREQEISIPSGCGIVKESDPEQEWLELDNKRKSIKEYLQL